MSIITQGGESALMMAATWGRTETVLRLLDAGANIDLQNKVDFNETEKIKAEGPGSVAYIAIQAKAFHDTIGDIHRGNNLPFNSVP